MVRNQRPRGAVRETPTEIGAGAGALIPDEQYEQAGATIGDPWSADVVVKVNPPTADEIGLLNPGSTMIGFLEPHTSPEIAEQLRRAGVTGFAMEAVPRISRAQSMDALSSQANVAGYKARLVTAEAVRRMRPGSVVVDLAGETGGNCELTVPGETVVRDDVTVASPLNLPATMPEHASELYARNVQALLELMLTDGKITPDLSDEILAACCVTRGSDLLAEAR